MAGRFAFSVQKKLVILCTVIGLVIAVDESDLGGEGSRVDTEVILWIIVIVGAHNMIFLAVQGRRRRRGYVADSESRGMDGDTAQHSSIVRTLYIQCIAGRDCGWWLGFIRW